MRVFLLLFLSAPAHAGYFTQHVKESIVINQERRPIYREITAGKSDRVLSKLISLERQMIPFAIIYDLKAKSFQKSGIPIMKDEFVSMNAEFDPTVRKFPEVEFENIPWEEYRSDLKDLIRKKDQAGLLSQTLAIVEEMKKQPEYWCLTRHLVESFYRFAYFLPSRVSAARERGVRSPEKLLWDIIDFHLIGFPKFVKIDRLAAPIQKEGIPILCQELPDLLQDLPRSVNDLSKATNTDLR